MDGELAPVQAETEAQMTIGKGFGLYMILFVAFWTMVGMAQSFTWFPGALAFFGYFIAGFIMNRVVLRGLIEWHPVYNTIDNVASGKLKTLVLWPITYPVLFFKLGVIKHL